VLRKPRYQEFIAREIIPSQYMEGDREREVLPPFRNLGKGAPTDTPPSIPLVFHGPGVAGSCGDGPPDGVARRSLSPPSPLHSLPGLPLPPLPSPHPSPSAPARWDLEASGRRGGAGGRDGDESPGLRETHAVTRRVRQRARAMGTSLVVHHCVVGTAQMSRDVSERGRHRPRYAGT
jgi:hypothetical protein